VPGIPLKGILNVIHCEELYPEKFLKKFPETKPMCGIVLEVHPSKEFAYS
jgi:hypothetical protein